MGLISFHQKPNIGGGSRVPEQIEFWISTPSHRKYEIFGSKLLLKLCLAVSPRGKYTGTGTTRKGGGGGVSRTGLVTKGF